MFRRIFNKFAISNGIEPLKRNITTILKAEPILPAFDPDVQFAEAKKMMEQRPVGTLPSLPEGESVISESTFKPTPFEYRGIGACTWLEQKKKMTEAQKEQERYFGDEYAGD